MNDLVVTERLKSLQGIRPDAVFLAHTRTNILRAITPAASPFGLHGTWRPSLKTFIPAFRMSFVMGAFSLFLFLGAHRIVPQSAETVASLNADAIQAERPQATEDKTNAHYFNGVSPVISLALTDIADPSTNWGSAAQIKQSIAVLYKNN